MAKAYVTVIFEFIASQLREFQPDSIKLATLKTQLAYSLSLFQQNISEGIKIYTYSNKKIAEGETLLSMPKDQLKFHREELLNLKSEIDILNLKIQDVQAKENQLAKQLLSTSDEIDVLITSHS